MDDRSTEIRLILECDNIRVTPRGMEEFHANRVLIFVPANEIGHIILRFGRSDHRPMVTMLIGIALSLAGVIGLMNWSWLRLGIATNWGWWHSGRWAAR